MANALTPYEVREFQRAINAWTGHHCKDLLGHIRVDSVLGAQTKKVALRTAFYFGVGQPTIRQWDKSFTPAVVRTLTEWFTRPSSFYKTHKLAWPAGKARILAERAKRVVRSKNGLLKFDGVWVAAWIYPILVEARKRGWQGTIPDKIYGGFRTYAMQKRLYDDYQAGGGIAASPDLPSNHQLKTWDGGAADCSFVDQLDQVLSGMKSDLGRQGDAPNIDPVHFSSHHRYNRTGHF